MDLDNLTAFVTLLVALSVASERLVEIVKGIIPCPWLHQEHTKPQEEALRKALLQGMAVGAGILTAWLASPALEGTLLKDGWWKNSNWFTIIALGLLASGGSGFWNSIQTYLVQVKGIKTTEAQITRTVADVKKVDAQAQAAASQAKIAEAEVKIVQAEQSKKAILASGLPVVRAPLTPPVTDPTRSSTVNKEEEK